MTTSKGIANFDLGSSDRSTVGSRRPEEFGVKLTANTSAKTAHKTAHESA